MAITHTYQTKHTISPYTILGVKEGSSQHTVTQACQHLLRRFKQESLMNHPQSWVQTQLALMAIEDAYKRIVEGDPELSSEEAEQYLCEALHPKLGQLLVNSGVITFEQLEEAVTQQKTLDLSLGEILKNSSLITQMELDTFLLNQCLINLPPDSPYALGQRLLGLGLITDDMLCIALLEQRTNNKLLGEVLVDRGWLSQEILDVLIEDQSKYEDTGYRSSISSGK